MPTEMKSVYSSHINEIGWSSTTKDLVVVFDTGKSGAYKKVPEDVATAVCNAPSVGRALNQMVKGVYEYEPLGG